MNYLSMLDRLDWHFTNGKNEIEKLDRILLSLRRSLSNCSTSEASSSYRKFWQCIVDRNIYMSALIFKRIEKGSGESDLCAQTGLSIIKEDLERIKIEDEWMWRLLAEIEMNVDFHIKEYVRYAVDNGMLKRSLKYLKFSNSLPNSVIFYIYSVITSDGQFRRDALLALSMQKWTIDVSTDSDKLKILEIINSLVHWNDIPSLINLLDMCVDLKFSDYSDKTRLEWREYLLGQQQPIAMELYRKILKREALATEDILNELFYFTSWQTGNLSYTINNYLYFAYGVSKFPERFDYFAGLVGKSKDGNQYISTADKEISSKSIQCEEDLYDTVGENSKKYYNYRIVEKPFRTLIRTNPDRVPDFLEIVAPVSLYNYSKIVQYKKSSTWIETSGYYLNDYINYIDYIVEKLSPTDVMFIYMNSPLKSQIDLYTLLKRLYRPDIGYVDLSKELEDYTFCGKLSRKQSEDNRVSYQVSVSNASSSYRFPIHNSWTALHINDLENDFNDGEPVYFKIMSIHCRGMAFAYDIAKKPHRTKKENTVGEVKSNVLKDLDKFKNDTIPLQGNNVEEKIRLYVIAMICDDEGRILVGRTTRNSDVSENLPYLPIANNESSDKTIRRLLKYNLGFHGNFSTTPCGIRHLCVGNNMRSVFFAYRINIASLLEVQKTLVPKKNMVWRDIEEYKENIVDFISASFIGALNSNWTEQTLIL